MLVSRVDQKVDTKQDAAEGATPATHVRTEFEVPSQGIHRTVVSDSQQDIAGVERRNNVRIQVFRHVEFNLSLRIFTVHTAVLRPKIKF
jgi:hypothetical protein